MSSSVYFRFKSQKEPTRVPIDGTGISVFELKREIINISKLGDGTDFELSIYNESTNEEYDDDTTIIPRSTTVLARRLPANKPGKGGAARYVSGRAPVKALGGARGDAAKTSAQQAGKSAELSAAQTEEERMKAIMGLEAQNWEQEKQQMATQQKVFYGKPNQMKAANVPEGEPPHGYVCYRCGQKGHWIQACPTNNDPNFKGPIKIKRTTGIPKSFLKQVEKPTGLDGADMSELQGVMVDADGNFVIAHSDEKTWKQYQEKQKQAAEAQKSVISDKELQSRGIECPIDKRMFVEPMKTPCCGRTYCGDCITNALIENDLVCPGCSTDGVLLDNLVEDAEAKEKIKAYEAEKAQQKKEDSKSPTLSAASPVKGQVSDLTPKSPKSPSQQRDRSKSPTTTTTDGPTTSKKRTADEANDEQPKEDTVAPAMKRQKSTDSSKTKDGAEVAIKSPVSSKSETQNPQPMSLNSFMPPDFSQMSQNNVGNNNSFPQMPFPMPNSMPFMPPMPGMPNMNMMNGMMNPMMMASMMNNMGGMGGNGFNANTFNPNNFNPMNMNMNMNGMPFNNNMNMNHNMNNRPQHFQGEGQQNNNFMANKFANQQRSQGNGEESPYMRQPVNPHRHQNRQKRGMRPSDYREL